MQHGTSPSPPFPRSLPSAPVRARPGASTREDPLARFRRQIRQYEPLSPHDEAALIRRYRDHGDQEAGQRLVLANLCTVVKLAMRYHARLGSAFDLIQEGSVGLLRALDRFDPSRGVPFSAYARYWIRAMILRFVMENQGLVKVGSTRASRRVFFELARERARMIQASEQAEPHDLARRLGIDEGELGALRVALAPQESLDAPDGDIVWHDRLPSQGADPEAIVIRKTTVAIVRQALRAFADEITCDRERTLLDERLLSDDPQSLADLGRRFGVTRERMRQLEKRLKQRVRAFLSDEFGGELEIAA